MKTFSGLAACHDCKTKKNQNVINSVNARLHQNLVKTRICGIIFCVDTVTIYLRFQLCQRKNTKKKQKQILDSVQEKCLY